MSHVCELDRSVAVGQHSQHSRVPTDLLSVRAQGLGEARDTVAVQPTVPTCGPGARLPQPRHHTVHPSGGGD